MNSKLSHLPHVTFDFMLNNSHNIFHRPPFENLVHSRIFLVEMIPVQRKQEIKICSLLNMIDYSESNAVLYHIDYMIRNTVAIILNGIIQTLLIKKYSDLMLDR